MRCVRHQFPTDFKGSVVKYHSCVGIYHNYYTSNHCCIAVFTIYLLGVLPICVCSASDVLCGVPYTAVRSIYCYLILISGVSVLLYVLFGHPRCLLVLVVKISVNTSTWSFPEHVPSLGRGDITATLCFPRLDVRSPVLDFAFLIKRKRLDILYPWCSMLSEISSGSETNCALLIQHCV